ncbi:DUF342 domain-containing protein [Pelobacter propionicus]|uniref:Flagellar Assembly Protein A N-terminal region domain-containing protein n=1 Tax=Pelobacter propionicus (strain DSM 2379 / NBRC 103807 / OttBd1) TaxID=338966 RepID=A1AR71_PELPD|nr:FapA family protein [Pelobacter propionicus]ABK99841.1 protein of unknown function DUF342 [Pelobacter propionicus DSM 2379]
MESVPTNRSTTTQGGAGREFKKLGYTLYVWIAEDKLECRLSYVPNQQGTMMTAEELKGYLAQSGVREGIIPQAFDDFVTRAAAGQTLAMALIAEGTPPEAGEDGHIQYTARESVVVRSACDESVCVDMHNVQSFINVMPGDEIGRVIPPTSGRAGRSVTGQPIIQKPGKALKLKIGGNIRLLEDGSTMVAEAAGRVCCAGGEISVAEEFIVGGDVDFGIGSIVFNGYVEVRGDVLDGFSITAAKGLRVNGNIGACAIQSDGDIVFCGMDGQKKGTIVCGGSITANFIHETDVECSGDLNIEVELHNSQIRSLGRVVVKRGAIAGGSCTALGGIQTRKVGSGASVKTVLCAGADFRDCAEYERLLVELERNGVRTSQVRQTAEIDELRGERAVLMEKVRALRTRSHERANAKINVTDMLYDNSFLWLGLQVREKVDERQGPFSAIANSIEGGVRFVEMTSLDVGAADIEQAFVREHAMRSQVRGE